MLNDTALLQKSSVNVNYCIMNACLTLIAGEIYFFPLFFHVLDCPNTCYKYNGVDRNIRIKRRIKNVEKYFKGCYFSRCRRHFFFSTIYFKWRKRVYGYGCIWERLKNKCLTASTLHFKKNFNNRLFRQVFLAFSIWFDGVFFFIPISSCFI